MIARQKSSPFRITECDKKTLNIPHHIVDKVTKSILETKTRLKKINDHADKTNYHSQIVKNNLKIRLIILRRHMDNKDDFSEFPYFSPYTKKNHNNKTEYRYTQIQVLLKEENKSQQVECIGPIVQKISQCIWAL